MTDPFTELMEREYPEWGSVWAQAEAETGRTMESPVERIRRYTPPAMPAWDDGTEEDDLESDDYLDYGFYWPPYPGESW